MKKFKIGDRTFIRLRKGMIIRASDWQWINTGIPTKYSISHVPAEAFFDGKKVLIDFPDYGNHFYREVKA